MSDNTQKYPEIVILVPYRDRESFKNLFNIYMSNIMDQKGKSNKYEIYYMHQKDNRPFNRGAMKNLGFLYIKRKYIDNYQDIKLIFQDIDTLPGNKEAFSTVIARQEVKHFFGTKTTLGGMFIMYGEDFEEINGFTNYWGWGMEDNILKDRCVKKKYNINYDLFHPFFSKDFIQCSTGNFRKIDNNAFFKYNDDRHNFSRGISEIKGYTFEEEEIKPQIYMVHCSDWTIPESHDNIEFRKSIPTGKMRDSPNGKLSMMNKIIGRK